MYFDKVLEGSNIYLRRLTSEDVTDDYVRWMNDPDINEYLESRFVKHSIESIKSFVRSVTNDNNYLFGIFVKDTRMHIGNIKIGGINNYHRYADVGFLIGEKSCWHKGFATEAIGLATDFAFNTLKLHKVWGGAYSPNIGSIKAFLRNGYEVEGRKKNQYLLNGIYYDDIIFGKINPNE